MIQEEQGGFDLDLDEEWDRVQDQELNRLQDEYIHLLAQLPLPSIRTVNYKEGPR